MVDGKYRIEQCASSWNCPMMRCLQKDPSNHLLTGYCQVYYTQLPKIHRTSGKWRGVGGYHTCKKGEGGPGLGLDS